MNSNPHVPVNRVQEMLLDRGLERPLDSIQAYRRKWIPSLNHGEITLEQSYEIRELHHMGLAVGQIAQAINLEEKSVVGHLDELKIWLNPVPWTKEEDQCLSDGINKYEHKWTSIKEPLYGRSVASCVRRAEMLTRRYWSKDEDKTLKTLLDKYIPVEDRHTLSEEELKRIGAHFQYKSAIMCFLRIRFLTYGSVMLPLKAGKRPPSTSTGAGPSKRQALEQHRAGRTTRVENVSNEPVSIANQLYNKFNAFSNFPRFKLDPVMFPTPEDNVPWTENEIKVAFSCRNTPWNENVERTLRAAGRSINGENHRSAAALEMLHHTAIRIKSLEESRVACGLKKRLKS